MGIMQIPPPYNRNKRHRLKYFEGVDINDIASILGTDTEIIFRIGKRELGRTKNTTVLGGRTSLLENSFGLAVNPEQHITLNTVMGIPHNQTNNVLTNRLNRKIDYFMVGDGAESKAVPGKIFEPKNYEVKLYHHIPFRYVPVTNDLTPQDRISYRLRKVETFNGQDYVGYYAKKFDPGMLYLIYNETPYIPIETDTTPVNENDASHRLSGGSVLCYVQFLLTIEPHECKEFFQITKGSLDNASISEAGTIYASDLPNSNENGNNELAAAELFSKFSTKPHPFEEGSSLEVEYRIYSK
jgi:hypothetical protein